MKRIFLLAIISVCLGLTASAQLTISIGGIDVTNQEVSFDSLPLNQNINHIFVIHNQYSYDIICNFLRKDICPPSAYTHLFCLGDHCFSSSVFAEDEPILAGAEMDFHPTIMLTGNTTGYAFRYTFWNSLAIADSVWMILKNGTCGMINVDNPVYNKNISIYPNPAINGFELEYDLDISEGLLEIRSMVGSTVKSVPIETSKGRLFVETADLPEGLYVCSVLSEGKVIRVLKLVVGR